MSMYGIIYSQLGIDSTSEVLPVSRVISAALICSLLFMSPAYAQTVEFSGTQLPHQWDVSLTGESKINVLNGMLALITKEGFAKCLIAARPGDWIIETFVTGSEMKDDSFHGIIVESGNESFLCFGRNALGLRAFVNKNGNSVEIPVSGEIGKYLQIRKTTRQSDVSTYWFYTGTDERNSLNCVGSFIDENHLFDECRYGLYGISNASSNMVFDFFVDAVPENEYDFFTASKVNAFWAQEAKGISLKQNGSLMATMTSASKADDPRIVLRPSLNEDWSIDTCVTANQTASGDTAGLLVYKNASNYLLLGTDREGSVTFRTMIDGSEKMYATAGIGNRVRIRKCDNEYRFFASKTGYSWEEAGIWVDETKALEDARVGLGYQGVSGRPIQLVYQYYRENPLPNGVIQGVTDLTEICREFGSENDGALNETTQRYGFTGSDLGVLIDAGDKTFMVFGDSFSAANQQGTWKSNLMAIIEDNDPSDGLTFSDMITNKRGIARQIIPSRQADFDEKTTIPTGGIYLDGRLYIHYFSVYHWSINAHCDFNFSGWAYSDDDGQTFTYAKEFFPAGSHFMLTSLVREGDDVYIFGSPSIRYGGLYLAKVPSDGLLDQSKYRYFSGLDADGEPIWSETEDDVVEIASGYIGEFSVVYNEWLGRYTLSYLSENTLDLEIRDAEHPWGTWSHPVTLVDRNTPGYTELIYAPFMLSKYFEDSGETIYFTTSKWTPYSVYWERAKLLK